MIRVWNKYSPLIRISILSISWAGISGLSLACAMLLPKKQSWRHLLWWKTLKCTFPILVDKDLFVIELKEEASDIFPSVEQITLTETAEEGKQLQTEQTYRLQKSINLTAEIIRQDSSKKNEEKLLPLIRHIIWQDTSSFYLHIPSTQGGMIRVKLDDNRYLQDKLALLSDLIFVEGFTEKAAGELDMTGAKVHFRPDIS